MGKRMTVEVDEALLATLTERASRNGRSPEQEMEAILATALRTDRASLVDELRREQRALTAKYGPFPDSTPLIREWRDQ